MDPLIFYDVENAVILTTLALGSVAVSTSDDILLRVSNPNDIYQAEDVIVSVSGTEALQLWLSTDGDTFTATVEIGDIAPGGVSPTFWLRRVTPVSATGSCTASLNAVPASWSYPVDTSTSDNVALDLGES